MRWILALVLWLGACQAQTPEWQLWTAVAASKHQEADQLIDQGQRRQAGERLEEVVATAPRAPNDVARVVLQDTHFRLARLHLEDHQPALALRQAQAGLSLGGVDSLFVANLLVVQGAAQEALGHSAEALTAYQRALRINEALLHDTLGRP
jgi:tetratricopeptide (TPR) repeat protein